MIPFPAIARAVSAAAATSELFTCCTTPLGALLVVFDFIVVVTVCLGGFAMVVVWCLFYVFFVFLKFLVCCIRFFCFFAQKESSLEASYSKAYVGVRLGSGVCVFSAGPIDMHRYMQEKIGAASTCANPLQFRLVTQMRQSRPLLKPSKRTTPSCFLVKIAGIIK